MGLLLDRAELCWGVCLDMKVEAGLAGGGSLGMVGWLRSSSQEPMVAARLARRPLLPAGAPEGAGASTCGATSG